VRESAGLAEKTWGKHSTVLRALREFAREEHEILDWPLKGETILGFASWCDKKRHLSAVSIRSYIQSVSKIQQMRGGL